MKKLLIVVLVAVVGVTGYAAYKSKGSQDRFVAELKGLLHVGTAPEETAPAKPVVAASPRIVSGAPRVRDIHLKNGKTLRGQIIIEDRDVTMIRLLDGKSVQVRNKDIK